MSFIQLNREEASDGMSLEKLISKRPTAFLLLSQIHLRAKRSNTNDDATLQVGECWIGDKSYCGNKEKIYRGDKAFLEKYGFAKFRGTKVGTIAKVLRIDLINPNLDCVGEPKGGAFPDQKTEKGDDRGDQYPKDSPIAKNYQKWGEPKGEVKGGDRAKHGANSIQAKTTKKGEGEGGQKAKHGANLRATNNNTPSGFNLITATLSQRGVAIFSDTSREQTISNLLETRYNIPPDPRGNRSPTTSELKALDYADVFRLDLGDTWNRTNKNGQIRKYLIKDSWFKLFKSQNGKENPKLSRLDQARSFFADHEQWESYSNERKFFYLTTFYHHGREGFLARNKDFNSQNSPPDQRHNLAKKI